MGIRQEGRSAFRQGLAIDRSPYIASDKNLRWMLGWNAAEKEFRELRLADARACRVTEPVFI